MTKEKMIEEIQKQEAKLNLDLLQYESIYAPDDGDYQKEISWNKEDATYQKKLHAWYAVYQIMETLGIARNPDLEENRKASDLNKELFIRREAARGIFYDERGNKI